MKDELLTPELLEDLESFSLTPFKDDVIAQLDVLQSRLDAAIEQLNGYYSGLRYDIPININHPNGTARTVNDSTVVAAKGGTVGLEYTITKTTHGALWWKSHTHRATLLISVTPPLMTPEVNTWPIPDNLDITDPQVLEDLTASLSQVVLRLHMNAEDEALLVRAVILLTGIRKLGPHYMRIRTNDLHGELVNRLKASTGHVKAEVVKLRQTVLETASEVNEELMGGAEAHIRKEIDLAKESLQQEVHRISEKLRAAEEKVEARLARREKDHEKRLEKEFTELRISNVTKQQQLDKLIAANEAREEALEAKLADHRKSLDTDFGLVAPALDGLFPDVEGTRSWNRSTRRYENTSTYENMVDAHLRTFYGQLVLKDLSQNRHVNIPQFLAILTLIRNECIALNKRPDGAEIRSVYAGARAIASFIAEHDVTFEEVQTQLKLAAANRKGPKPDVETFIERAVAYDFNMDKHAKGLHKHKAKTKRELGVK